ncbi:hypothetical protein POL68_26030 [Stigmatella sp. ncwal1]|uniref:HTH cro/C1-type domain-containing protein n=1 Tax=Stigmatella ashevillensis TaxID=2995309 RepID=A0ABT5DEA8_9BACT|nr:hypothetical protein [Stigmatella ashevillena]MDC0711953.1 hypothetical protein [Stigmatella ashevillena]
MKRKSLKRRWKGPLPTSGEIIGGVVGLFGWKPKRSVQDRTWRKFITGDAIHEDTRRQILRELIEERLRDTGELRTPAGRAVSREQMVRELEQVCEAHVSWWDALCARLKAALPMEASEFTNTVALRLAVVELAVRLAPLCLLHVPNAQTWLKEKPERIDIPEHLLTIMLRETLKHVRVTRNDLSEELDVSKEAVDQWLAKGKVIGIERLDEIAEVIAQKTGKDLDLLKALLRVTRLLTQVFQGVRDHVGKEELNWLVDGLWRLTQVAHLELEKMTVLLTGELRTQVLGELLVLGSETPLGPPLRRAMQAQEKDDSWRGVISAVPRQWERFLAKALAREQQYTHLRKVSQQEGFKYFMADEELITVGKMLGVLVPLDRLPTSFVELLEQPPEATAKQRLGLAWEYLIHLSSDEADPEAWRDLMSNAESCRLTQLSTDNAEEKDLWSLTSWAYYSQGLAKLYFKVDPIHTYADLLANAAWVEQIREALDALPPFPETVNPMLVEVLDALRKLKSAMERLPRMLREAERLASQLADLQRPVP